ncbi:uncharacterized protein LOC126736394 isoform X2 [Anthonomus grandis grandis]|uniref:uncharacterized protein LOC126736394 isoform X2 n=2 Tax=Anthonomus grandis grandis TaxID=2921223 RepID=UPI0021659AF0|nr:uncharacterized protein LOC126736394 isoform X2 [Anthonomus grandis grandis]
MLKRNLAESEESTQKILDKLELEKQKSQEPQKNLLPSFACSTQSVTTKIVELSKNYRDKCAELEKFKTKCSKLETVLHNMKKEPLEICLPEPIKKPEIDNSEIKLLQDKLNMTTNKMLEYKNANMQLKNDIRQLNKLLQQEIGEDPSSILGKQGWKGRAQVICDLQEKNKKLTEKLRSIKGASFEQLPQKESTDRISSKIFQLEKENEDLKSQNDACKKRIETLKSRSNMLEMEHQKLKLEIHNAKNRSSEDLQLMANISNQLAEAETTRKNALKEKSMEITKLNAEIQNLQAQLANYKGLVENLKTKRMDSCEQKITEKQGNQSDQGCSQILENEKQSLLELIQTHKNRLEEARREQEKYQQLLRMEKHKSLKLEMAVAKSEAEAGLTSRSRYSSMSQSSKGTEETLRSQLELAEENIKALQTRLKLEQNERKQDFQEFAKILSVKK